MITMYVTYAGDETTLFDKDYRIDTTCPSCATAGGHTASSPLLVSFLKETGAA